MLFGVSQPIRPNGSLRQFGLLSVQRDPAMPKKALVVVRGQPSPALITEIPLPDATTYSANHGITFTGIPTV